MFFFIHLFIFQAVPTPSTICFNCFLYSETITSINPTQKLNKFGLHTDHFEYSLVLYECIKLVNWISNMLYEIGTVTDRNVFKNTSQWLFDIFKK